MTTLLERYERQATLLKRDLRVTNRDISRDLELIESQPVENWKQVQNRIDRSGDPTMLTGGFAGMEITPEAVSEAAVTGGATELVLIPTARFAIAKNPQVPKLYRLYASGTSTTAATPGTYTLTPRIGPAPTNASPLIGIATGNITPVASATAAQWQLTGFVLIRTGGTAAVAVGSFWWAHSNTVGGGGPSTANAVFGGISASFDSTLTTTALWIGVTHATSTTNTWTPQAVGWLSAN